MSKSIILHSSYLFHYMYIYEFTFLVYVSRWVSHTQLLIFIPLFAYLSLYIFSLRKEMSVSFSAPHLYISICISMILDF